MENVTKALILIAAGIVPASALSQEPGEFGLGFGLSTLGATLEGTYRVSDRFGLRVPLGYLSVDDTETDDGIKYDYDSQLGGIGLLGDYYTGIGGLRITGGAMLSGYDVDGTGRGSGTLGDNTYNNVNLRYSADTKNAVMPMISLGYDGQVSPRWTLSADLGAMYTGGFDVSLTDKSGQVSQADLNKEIKDAEDDAPSVLPYVKFTATFRF
ncbi:hypothetical protein AB0T83_02750 [Fluviibacterium sp. DFM31]|uniref:Outer membrane protein beta-barrel domain-containing protein n=1 Tax=Meridianimarinicoccus marinus TaxID=3231483 RepID=A0ABV3L2D0_9RHOB